MCKQIVVLKEVKGGNVTYVSDTTHFMYVIMAKLNVETNSCFKGDERWECNICFRYNTFYVCDNG